MDIITVDIKIIKSHEVRKIFSKILKHLTCIRRHFNRFNSRVLTGLVLRELSAPQTPKLDLRGRTAAEREGREGDGVKEGEERDDRDNERRDQSEGKKSEPSGAQ